MMDASTLQTFDPATDADSFRGALGTFVTGVTVVTTDSPDGPVAIVANSFASVSLDVPMYLSHCGMPIIEGALATFECNLEATHDAGDHAVIIGRVTKAHHQGGLPLVFHAGKYGAFNAN